MSLPSLRLLGFSAALICGSPVLPAFAKPTSCQLSERAFVGNWSTPAGDEIVRGDVRAVAFELIDGKRIYNEWLHFRPMGSGTWRYERCKVTVTGNGYTMRFQFLSNDGRRLVEAPYQPGDPIYRRVH